MKLTIDHREKLSYAPLFKREGIIYTESTLKTGDYSVVGFEKEFSIERKTLNDFVNCVTFHRERFVKELERARKLKFFAIIIEANIKDIRSHNYLSKAIPQAIISSIYSWNVKYGVPILLVGSREEGASAVQKLSQF